jgi:hypothetical protein
VYRLEQLPEGAFVVYAAARTYTRESATVSPAATRADLTLHAGAWLSGTVRSARGASLKGAVVSATALDAHSAGGFARKSTDAKNRFEIVNLEPGLFQVAASQPGFTPTFAPTVRTSGSTSIELVLEEATATIGRLVDDDNHPIAGKIFMDRLKNGFPNLLGDILQAMPAPTGASGCGPPAGTHWPRSRSGRVDRVRLPRAEADLETSSRHRLGDPRRPMLRRARGSPHPGDGGLRRRLRYGRDRRLRRFRARRSRRRVVPAVGVGRHRVVGEPGGGRGGRGDRVGARIDGDDRG